ncbi:MAG: cyclophilin-like domain-containing protein, partial [Olpidium bornovanus]
VCISCCLRLGEGEAWKDWATSASTSLSAKADRLVPAIGHWHWREAEADVPLGVAWPRARRNNAANILLSTQMAPPPPKAIICYIELAKGDREENEREKQEHRRFCEFVGAKGASYGFAGDADKLSEEQRDSLLELYAADPVWRAKVRFEPGTPERRRGGGAGRRSVSEAGSFLWDRRGCQGQTSPAVSERERDLERRAWCAAATRPADETDFFANCVAPGDLVLGRLTFRLFFEDCPKAAENFRALCTGEKGVSKVAPKKPLYYKGCCMHRLVKGFVLQGGDLSIYGGAFKDEKAGLLKHRFAGRGYLGMANSGKDSNTSQFFITVSPDPSLLAKLNGKHVCFGVVDDESDPTAKSVLDALERLEQKSPRDESPAEEIWIHDCGQIL